MEREELETVSLVHSFYEFFFFFFGEWEENKFLKGDVEIKGLL